MGAPCTRVHMTLRQRCKHTREYLMCTLVERSTIVAARLLVHLLTLEVSENSLVEKEGENILHLVTAVISYSTRVAVVHLGR